MSARESISQFLRAGRHMIPSTLLSDPRFEQKLGCFVTLKEYRNGNSLRGCIGFPEPVHKLSEALSLAAVYAATADPRFPPVSQSELDQLTLEISILTKPEKITVSNQKELLSMIEIGKDGVMMNWTLGSGLLLPQVATEMNWTTIEYLENLCLKAGAPSHQWLTPGTVISKFRARIFQETTPLGGVILVDDSSTGAV